MSRSKSGSKSKSGRLCGKVELTLRDTLVLLARMKCLLPVVVFTLVVICGCASKPKQEVFSPLENGRLIVTPENSLTGRVLTYNEAGRFVVLDFPVGKVPGRDQTLFVYRQGLKVGELKVTGPERDTNTVADLVSGEAQKGDEVRDQ